MLTTGRVGDASQAAVRRSLAASLALQVELLRSLPAQPLRPGAPAWAQYDGGPWPEPHDPIFDFSSTPDEYTWLDDVAADAATVLRACSGRDVIGHSDWYAGMSSSTAGTTDALGRWCRRPSTGTALPRVRKR